MACPCFAITAGIEGGSHYLEKKDWDVSNDVRGARQGQNVCSMLMNYCQTVSSSHYNLQTIQRSGRKEYFVRTESVSDRAENSPNSSPKASGTDYRIKSGLLTTNF